MPESRKSQANPAQNAPGEQISSLPVAAPGPESLFLAGIGASAGGLEACSKLVEALNPADGMAYILVQHLDPTHASMMVDLLSSHTQLPIREARDGMKIERNHLYVIPPGRYLSVNGSTLHVSKPLAPHGARLPFDFLLQALAENYGARAAAVILSGTGADGSAGLLAIKKKGGLVIAQNPREAGYDGMPENAIRTGRVDFVLNAKDIPQQLALHARSAAAGTPEDLPKSELADDWLLNIINLLRSRTAYDFSLYKRGTLLRRTARRMEAAGIEPADMGRYYDVLKTKTGEIDLLAEDLLINVTNFFRDQKVFDLLATKIIPEMLRDRTPGLPVRIWVAGCSTGEETYSLAILFREQILLSNQNIKLQIFASDIDAEAVAAAREGVYPKTIESDISAARLAAFFNREDHNYRVTAELRSSIVFAVQDVLVDPPFSRLDMVSCRNLLIYLRPEGQAKVLSIFHFALREGGILLLGSAETADQFSGRFEEIAKAERIYRHTGQGRPGDYGFLKYAADNFRVPSLPEPGQSQPRQAAYAELCRRLVIETYAPAALLISQKQEVLFSVGPTERYLRVPSGHPTQDLLAMAPHALRGKLRSAIQTAIQQNLRVAIPGGKVESFGQTVAFNIDVKPVVNGAENLLLVCFVDAQEAEKRVRAANGYTPDLSGLERELEVTKAELQGAIRNLEISTEEQKAINEEALSVNEEHQSTNEELLTSKEELQSLNEELTALNSQLQETLERQRTTSNDLQNVLYSTDVATLFLDTGLKIRLFTPATKSLFSVIPGDIGRPLADLRSLAGDSGLDQDARQVLDTLESLEREIKIPGGIWFSRRILPYRTQDDGVEGVVITYSDITERKATAKALEEAKQLAEQANLAKSRFLAAASHDLRQPLQTLALLQGQLAKMVESEAAQKLLAMLDQTLGGMSTMLNTMLDINQIDAGSIRANISVFPINDLLVRLRGEFAHHAAAQGIALRFATSSLMVCSDPALLEQMLRNLLSNALKYTKRGKVLVGCRRHGDMVSIEVWDTGIGIPKDQLQEIFKEYHQLGNAGNDRMLGVGLGLSIVQRLSDLLGHRVGVQSRSGRGSGFNIEVKLPPETALARPEQKPDAAAAGTVPPHRTGTILVVEDDPDVRALLELFLKEEGHNAVCFRDGGAALDLVQRGSLRPDLILADYNLPGGVNGVQLALRLREKLQDETPVIILTGDISTVTLRAIAGSGFVQLNKPVKLQDLAQIIQMHLPVHNVRKPAAASTSRLVTQPTVYIVDDDPEILETVSSVLATEGRQVMVFASGEAFLNTYQPGGEACLLVDAYLPGMSGLKLLQTLVDRGDLMPAIMITGHSDVRIAVRAMKAGAADFIEKPIGSEDLRTSVNRALEHARDSSRLTAFQASAAQRMATLTPRQREILNLILEGNPNKNIAADLGISQRTVETHRAAIMQRTGAPSLPALARLALAAARQSGERK